MNDSPLSIAIMRPTVLTSCNIYDLFKVRDSGEGSGNIIRFRKKRQDRGL
jgi:hypothetical protein